MAHTRIRRPGGRLLVLAAMVTAMVGVTVDAASAAPAPGPGSATASKAAGPSAAAQKEAATKEVARIKAAGARVAPPSVWSSDNSSNTWNGGCTASAHSDYYPAGDQAVISTTVSSPYWFAACRVNAQLWVDTAAGSFPSAANYAVACAVFDASCASTQTTTGNYYGATPGLTAFVAQINAALVRIGLPPTYTAEMAVTGIHLTFANAG